MGTFLFHYQVWNVYEEKSKHNNRTPIFIYKYVQSEHYYVICEMTFHNYYTKWLRLFQRQKRFMKTVVTTVTFIQEIWCYCAEQNTVGNSNLIQLYAYSFIH
jgi:hypothetical protein